MKKVILWGGKHQEYFEILKEKLRTTPILDLLDLQNHLKFKPMQVDTPHEKSWCNEVNLFVIILRHLHKQWLTILDMIRNCMLWFKVSRNVSITWLVRRKLYTLIINHYSICSCNLSYNSPGISGGWVSCNNFIC